MMAEMPLTLFTTLAPLGAGAFVTLALAFCLAKLSDEQLKKIDRMTALPLGIVLLGFVCAFFHLSSPLHAFGVFAGVGSSPLSNEILAGVVFLVLAVVYWALALSGKLSLGARKGFAAVLAVLALVFAWFMGAAYAIETIVSWNTMMVPVQMLGFCLVGGAALGAFVLALAGSLDAVREGAFKSSLLGELGVGLVLGIGGACAQVFGASGLGNAVASGSALVSAATTPLAVGAVCLVASAALLFAALRGKGSTALLGGSVALVAVGIFAARIAFYAVQLSVGIFVG